MFSHWSDNHVASVNEGDINYQSSRPVFSLLLCSFPGWQDISTSDKSFSFDLLIFKEIIILNKQGKWHPDKSICCLVSEGDFHNILQSAGIHN